MKRTEGIVSPDGALAFLFGIFALLMWYTSIDNRFNPATLLSLGMTWLILSSGALIASLINMIRGEQTGNMNLLATILLGFFPGINTLITLAAALLQHPYRPAACGIMYMVGSLFCMAAAWHRRTEPFYIFIKTVLVGTGLFLLGLGDVSGWQPPMAAGGWCLFGFALLSFYFGLSVLYPYFDSRLPQGRPLIRRKPL